MHVTWGVPKLRVPEKEYLHPPPPPLHTHSFVTSHWEESTPQWLYLVLLCFLRQSATIPIVSSLRATTSLLWIFQPFCNLSSLSACVSLQHPLLNSHPVPRRATHCTPLDTQVVTAVLYWHLLRCTGRAGGLKRQPESPSGHTSTHFLHLEAHAWLRMSASTARTQLQHTATQELQPA